MSSVKSTRKTPGEGWLLGLDQARCPRAGPKTAGKELLAPKQQEKPVQGNQATPLPAVGCKHLLKLSAVPQKVCEVGGSPQALISTGGNQGMYKHCPDQPTPHLYFQTAWVRLGVISVARNCREQPQTPLPGLPGSRYPTHPAEIILIAKPREKAPQTANPLLQKAEEHSFPSSAAPRALSEHPGAVTACSNTTPEERRKEEQGEGEGVRATSSNQGNPDLFKENMFTGVVKYQRRELSHAERGAGTMSGLAGTPTWLQNTLNNP